MGNKEMLKAVNKMISFYLKKDAQGLYEELLRLKALLMEEIEKERAKKIEKEKEKKEKQEQEEKKVGPLIKWYIQLWNGEPPEKYMGGNHYGIIGRIFKVLLQIYEKDGFVGEEKLKEDYLAFYEREKKGIVFFKRLLPNLKVRVQAKEVQVKEWSSYENQRGREYYKAKGIVIK